MGLKPAIIVVMIVLGGCGPLKMLGLGKPGIAANAQAGAENNQAIVSNQTDATISKSTAAKIEQNTGSVKVKSDRIDTVVVKEGAPMWIIWALVIAVFLDSPLRWPEQIVKAFRRRNVP